MLDCTQWQCRPVQLEDRSAVEAIRARAGHDAQRTRVPLFIFVAEEYGVIAVFAAGLLFSKD